MSASQPSGFCDGCLHGTPFEDDCERCDLELMAGVRDAEPEVVLAMLERLSAKSDIKLATYVIPGTNPPAVMGVIHSSNASWALQPAAIKTGAYAYRVMRTSAPGVSGGLVGGRSEALKVLHGAQLYLRNVRDKRDPVITTPEQFR
jgi:hypothetical protein